MNSLFLTCSKCGEVHAIFDASQMSETESLEFTCHQCRHVNPGSPGASLKPEQAVEQELLSDQHLWLSNALEHANAVDRLIVQSRIEEIESRLAELRVQCPLQP